jgi:hypothetical protein
LQALARVFRVKMETLMADLTLENEVERALSRDPQLRDDDKRALLTIYQSLKQPGVSES